MTIKTVRNLRRVSQVLFFLLFFWLILKTNFNVNFSSSDINNIALPYPVSIFLQIDPLVGLTNILANGGLFEGLIWSLIILIPVIFIGRFFCGWICPLGSLNHWVSEIGSERSSRKGAARIESNRYKKYQRIKYYILFFLLAAALFGTLQIGLFDPLALLARSIGTVVLPTIQTSALAVVNWAKSFGVPAIGNSAQGIYDLISPFLLNFRQAHFHTIFSIGLFFVIIIILNRIYTRFWCRGICPLGALLGLFSRFAILGLEKNERACTHCNKCLLHCQGADNPDIGQHWRQPECHLCLNCQAGCPESALQFRFFPAQNESKANPVGIQSIDISRRKTMASVAGGIALYPLLRSGDDFEINPYSRLIRPPASAPESDFLARCIRCGQCMRVCPNNALHPTLMESGLEGIWSPILIPRIGYCEPTCILCSEVCPTGAIMKMTVKEKVGDKDNPPIRIGTAFIDKGRCLPHAMARPCIVCEEWCPTSPKAIYLSEQKILDRNGNVVMVKQPQVDPNACTGCGACEYACPVVNEPAIYVMSVGESRSAYNQILLQRKGIKRN
jgi:polyferredoxin